MKIIKLIEEEEEKIFKPTHMFITNVHNHWESTNSYNTNYILDADWKLSVCDIVQISIDLVMVRFDDGECTLYKGEFKL